MDDTQEVDWDKYYEGRDSVLETNDMVRGPHEIPAWYGDDESPRYQAFRRLVGKEDKRFYRWVYGIGAVIAALVLWGLFV